MVDEAKDSAGESGEAPKSEQGEHRANTEFALTDNENQVSKDLETNFDQMADQAADALADAGAETIGNVKIPAVSVETKQVLEWLENGTVSPENMRGIAERWCQEQFQESLADVLDGAKTSLLMSTGVALPLWLMRSIRAGSSQEMVPLKDVRVLTKMSERLTHVIGQKLPETAFAMAGAEAYLQMMRRSVASAEELNQAKESGKEVTHWDRLAGLAKAIVPEEPEARKQLIQTVGKAFREESVMQSFPPEAQKWLSQAAEAIDAHPALIASAVEQLDAAVRQKR